ncbi:hypothetical protein ACTFD2_08455, partial [Campylobacter jejuni]
RTEADILTSPALIGRVVDRLSLVNDPEFNPKPEDGPKLSDRFIQAVNESIVAIKAAFKNATSNFQVTET